MGDLILKSPAFENGAEIPSRYTCDGENINPTLIIENVPEGVKSLVLIMDDPDATGGATWDHWLLWNIPPETAEIPEGQDLPALPDRQAGGRQGRWVVGKITGGSVGYRGPCPPYREDRYFFKLYALDTTLDLPAETTGKAGLEAAMQGHILSQAELMGRYNRQ